MWLSVNEIPELVHGNAKLFADDTEVFDKKVKKTYVTEKS